MALIKCPECEKDISTKATDCPHCGFPLSEYISDINDINHKDTNVEITLDINEDYVQTVNGIKIDIADLLMTNGYERTKASKTLNAITKIGIVQAKNIIDDFISENPEYDKEKEFKEFIAEQSNLTQIFSEDTKFDKISVDHASKLFRLGFWSYIYKFSEIGKVSIKEVKRNIFVIIEINHEYIPDIKIRIPNLKNLKKVKKFNNIINMPFKKIIISREDALKKAEAISRFIMDLKNYNEEI